ncbi:sulfate ABC transporter ATP-binding protein [Pedobacter psychrophilus]|uniref:Sulfate ABC transporter ATP-binding protein n=1 Tax=Pedobacter psychrophilus TaxID=1826909 RepID=A0A179DCQ1_9SPHI|nr:ABC transporter ATP-binding protein [Pedobacter psychrophilus]OAQ38309.1 sulfate ABC transporter ATP-binding protein [Pedobacter psychrophilus]
MFLQINHIQKKYKDKLVIQDVSFGLEAHQTLSILGKSGCGKSTLLKIIAGIEEQNKGDVFLNEKNISNINSNERNIVYLFQEPLLFPNLNVFENIAFGLRIRKLASADVEQKVEQMLESLELKDHDKKMPHQISGGQKQRVAFGRALIINPPLILLDEPFSSLDVETRATMQQLYKTIAKKFNITALFVTHDLKEALLMGDKISYMDKGLLEIFDSKKDFIEADKTGVKSEIEFWNNL